MYTDGTNVMDVSYSVMDPACSFASISVSERLDRGQMVISGPRTCKLIKDDHNVRYIEEIAKDTTGLDITRSNGSLHLSADLMEKPDSDHIRKRCQSPARPDLGNQSLSNPAPQTNAKNSFLVTSLR